MYDQVMAAKDPLIPFHELRDPVIFFRFGSFSDQRFQCISCDPDTRPHDYKRDSKPYDAVRVDPGQPKEQDRCDRRRSGDHIPHGVRRSSHHDL